VLSVPMARTMPSMVGQPSVVARADPATPKFTLKQRGYSVQFPAKAKSSLRSGKTWITESSEKDATFQKPRKLGFPRIPETLGKRVPEALKKRAPALKKALPALGLSAGLMALSTTVPMLAWAQSAAPVVAAPTFEELMLTKYIPTFGTFLSNALYFTFLPGVIAALKEKNIGSLNPIPVGMQLISTISWAQYGMAIKNPFIAASNVRTLSHRYREKYREKHDHRSGPRRCPEHVGSCKFDASHKGSEAAG